MRKYKRFLWLLAPLVIISFIVSSVEAATRIRLLLVLHQTTDNASAGYDWSKVPVYAGSTEATDLDNAQGGPPRKYVFMWLMFPLSVK